MLEIIFIACLIASPTQCRERMIPFDGGSLRQCERQAQWRMAEWIATHPKWAVRKWRCADGATAREPT